MTQIAVIDLGSDWELPVEPVTALSLWPHRRLLLLLGLLLALCTAGPGPQVVPGLRAAGSLPALHGRSLLITPDMVIVNQTARIAAYRITAYPLAGGAADAGPERLWTVPAPSPVEFAFTVAASRVLLGRATIGTVAWFTGYDLDTGRVLWSAAGSAAVPVPGSDALLLRPAAGTADPLRLLDARTGRTRWSSPDLGGELTVRGPVLVQLGAGGATAVLSVATGAVRASAVLDRSGGGAWVASSTGPGATDQLYLTRGPAAGAELAAYRLDTLALRWRVGLPVADAGGLNFVSPCGPVLCVMTQRQMFGLDPATGAVRWATADWLYAEPVGGDRILALAAVGRAGARVVDAGDLTGRLELLRWGLVYAGGEPARVVAELDPAGRGTWFAALDVAGDRILPLGLVSGVRAGTCQAGLGLLACPVGTGDLLRLWRYPWAADSG